MRLALNFPRIDPTRGGAETYIVDLCRSLVRAGHQVDLYAESWKEGSLPLEVRCIAVSAPGHNRRKQIWNFALNSAAALEQAEYDCTVGFINAYAHDVIIPQGGVHAGSLEANSRRFAGPLWRRLYVLGKMLNPRYSIYRAIERRQYAPDRQARVIAVSNLVRRQLQQFHHVPRERIQVLPNAIDPERVKVSQPGAVRVPQPAGTRTRRPGRPVRGPQLRTQGSAAIAAGTWGQEPRWCPADPPAGLRRRTRRTFSPAGEVAGDRPGGPFPWLLLRHPRMLRGERLLRPAHVLRPLLAGGAGSPGLRATSHHNASERCRRADHRRPAGLCPARTRRPWQLVA